MWKLCRATALKLDLRSWCVFEERKKRDRSNANFENQKNKATKLQLKTGVKKTNKEFFTSKLQMPHPSMLRNCTGPFHVPCITVSGETLAIGKQSAQEYNHVTQNLRA